MSFSWDLYWQEVVNALYLLPVVFIFAVVVFGWMWFRRRK